MVHVPHFQKGTRKVELAGTSANSAMKLATQTRPKFLGERQPVALTIEVSGLVMKGTTSSSKFARDVRAKTMKSDDVCRVVCCQQTLVSANVTRKKSPISPSITHHEKIQDGENCVSTQILCGTINTTIRQRSLHIIPNQCAERQIERNLMWSLPSNLPRE